MTLLLEFREKCKQLYTNYGFVMLPIFKFVLAFIIFQSINASLNVSEVLDNIFVLLILALICSITPLNVMVFLGIMQILMQCASIGTEVFGFALALFALVFILYIRFTPNDAIVLLLTPLAFYLKIPCVIPIGYGLTKSPISVFSAVCGVIVYGFISVVQQKSSILQGADNEELLQNLKILADGLLDNQRLLLYIVSFVAVMLIVYGIRRLSVDYAWQIAIFVGAITYVILMVTACLVADVDFSMITLIAGVVGSIVVAELAAFFLFHVDYSRTERLQFEDDEYYYYVKAVPKIRITEKNVTVKKFEESDSEMKENQFRKQEYMPAQGNTVIQNTISYDGLQRNFGMDSQFVNTDENEIQNVDFESKLEESLRDL